MILMMIMTRWAGQGVLIMMTMIMMIMMIMIRWTGPGVCPVPRLLLLGVPAAPLLHPVVFHPRRVPLALARPARGAHHGDKEAQRQVSRAENEVAFVRNVMRMLYLK